MKEEEEEEEGKLMEIGHQEQRIISENLPVATVQKELARLKTDRVIERIWERDHTVWGNNPEEISNRLGWLQSHRLMAESLAPINDFVA